MPRPGYWLLALLMTGLADRASGSEGSLDAIRDDVRGTAATASPSPPVAGDDRNDHSMRRGWDEDEDLDGNVVAVGAWLSFWLATSPIWVPIEATADDMAPDGYFQRYPYHVTHGSIVRPGDPLGGHAGYGPRAAELGRHTSWLSQGLCPPRLRRWSGRFSTEYANAFNDLGRLNGRLIFNSASRFGFDTEMSYLEERLPGPARDHLWLGDANAVFRFAQSNWSEWRIGLGVNWLDDDQRTDYGFNFTYGVDLFVHRPWITSLDIDWGTLGHTGLFRLRATTGVIFWGLETYVGYEYLDIGRTRTNSLLGGVRLWF